MCSCCFDSAFNKAMERQNQLLGNQYPYQSMQEDTGSGSYQPPQSGASHGGVTASPNVDQQGVFAGVSGGLGFNPFNPSSVGQFKKNMNQIAANAMEMQRSALATYDPATAQVYVEAWKEIGPSMFQKVGYRPVFTNDLEPGIWVNTWKKVGATMYTSAGRVRLYEYDQMEPGVYVEASHKSNNMYVSIGRVELPHTRPLAEEDLRPKLQAPAAASAPSTDAQETSASTDASAPAAAADDADAPAPVVPALPIPTDLLAGDVPDTTGPPSAE